MRSLSKKFLSNKKLFFSQSAQLGLKLDGESKFAVKIDLATNLGVEWPKKSIFGKNLKIQMTPPSREK